MPIPDWLTVGALVTLPDLDTRTAKHGHRYRVVHVESSPQHVATGIEVGVQPVDAPEYKRPKCVDMAHCMRWVDSDNAPDGRLPRILA